MRKEASVIANKLLLAGILTLPIALCGEIKDDDLPVSTSLGDVKIVFFRENSPKPFWKKFIDNINDDFFIKMEEIRPHFTNLHGIRLINTAAIDLCEGNVEALSSLYSNVHRLLTQETGLGVSVRQSIHECIFNNDTYGFFSNNQSAWTISGKGIKKGVERFESIFIHDWQMANQTFSGCIFHDRVTSDRFIASIAPGENIGIVKISTVESPAKLEPLPWTLFSPTDQRSSSSVGSWKGKSMAVISRGYVLSNTTKEMRRSDVNTARHSDEFKKVYSNGITILKKNFEMDRNQSIGSMATIDNLSVFSLDIECRKGIAEEIRAQHGITKHLKYAMTLIKRDSGFSPLQTILPPISSDAIVAIINCSEVPEEYSGYPVSQNLSAQGVPLTQLYNFTKGEVMIVSARDVLKLDLSPVEEILFRKMSFPRYPEKSTRKRLFTEVDLLIFD